MSDTIDRFKYRGVPVEHHMEDDIYVVYGETCMSLSDMRALVDARLAAERK